MTAHRVAALADLWIGDLVAARVAGTRLLVVRLGDDVHAYLDRCAHLGVALSEGTLEGGVLTCAAHHWQYDAATGHYTLYAGSGRGEQGLHARPGRRGRPNA